MFYFKAVLFSVFMVMASNTYAASFDCTQARTETEKAICNNVELSALDDQLAISYKKALNNHPLPDYVKSRQREWLRENKDHCRGNGIVACLKSSYIDRLDQLQARNLAVYSNTNHFSYPSTDTVIEVWQSNYGQWRLSVWGGFVIHRLASEDQGKAIYTGCEFEGLMKSKNASAATSLGSADHVINIEVDAQTFTFLQEPDFCPGFARLPDSSFSRVTR